MFPLTYFTDYDQRVRVGLTIIVFIVVQSFLAVALDLFLGSLPYTMTLKRRYIRFRARNMRRKLKGFAQAAVGAEEPKKQQPESSIQNRKTLLCSDSKTGNLPNMGSNQIDKRLLQPGLDATKDIPESELLYDIDDYLGLPKPAVPQTSRLNEMEEIK